jgi:hypothetical protein
MPRLKFAFFTSMDLGQLPIKMKIKCGYKEWD